jgi:hypothetical protein
MTGSTSSFKGELFLRELQEGLRPQLHFNPSTAKYVDLGLSCALELYILPAIWAPQRKL